MKTRTLITLSFVISALGAWPLAGTELTLAEAMSRARLSAREVAAAQARAEASQERLRQAQGYRWPELQIHEIWMRTDSPAEAFALTLNKKEFSFPDFVQGDPNNPDPVTAATTRFELSLPVYTGGQLSGRIDQARLAAEAAGESRGWAGDQAALQAGEAYIHLAQVREQVKLLEKSLETVDAHVALAESYVEQGMLVRSELLRAQVERSRIQDFLTEASGQARTAEAALTFRLAANDGESWQLSELLTPPELNEELDAWLMTAETRRDLAAARKMVDAAGLEQKVQRSAFIPQVGVLARYDLVDESLFGTDADALSFVAMASWSVWGGNRYRAAAVAAGLEAEAAGHEIEQFREGVRLQVRDAYEKATTARVRHSTALSAVDAATEAERITEERFRQGVVKMLDLLDATTAARESETRELMARAEAHLAGLELAVTAGRTPESAYGIQISEESRDDQ